MPASRRTFPVLFPLLVAVAGPIAARDRQPPFPDGLYGNVSLSEESGDLGGFEVRFFTDPVSGRRMAEFVLCEGWCNAVSTAEVVRDGDGFAFSHEEALLFTDGSRGKQRVRYRFVPVGRALLVSYDAEDGFVSDPWRIMRLRKAWGLEVARSEDVLSDGTP